MIRFEFFQEQIARLSKRFDAKYYEPKLCLKIYSECKTLNDEWLMDTVTDFLGHHRPALLDEFRAAIKNYRMSRHVHAIESPSQNPIDSIFSQEERDEMFNFIRKISRGLVSNTDAEQYAKMVNGIVRERSRKTCFVCDDGLVWATRRSDQHSGKYVFKCTCEIGMRRTETYPRWDSRFQHNYVNLNDGPEAS